MHFSLFFSQMLSAILFRCSRFHCTSLFGVINLYKQCFCLPNNCRVHSHHTLTQYRTFTRNKPLTMSHVSGLSLRNVGRQMVQEKPYNFSQLAWSKGETRICFSDQWEMRKPLFYFYVSPSKIKPSLDNKHDPYWRGFRVRESWISLYLLLDLTLQIVSKLDEFFIYVFHGLSSSSLACAQHVFILWKCLKNCYITQ